ncbi:hypothetical protein NKH72_28180 [Mesorhizobium sp. M0955]|uniref:hypothetical protein n=1 Tax=Mesorhizobium sp. M0955 TaxID=2957033 RepID=UPI003334F71F
MFLKDHKHEQKDSEIVPTNQHSSDYVRGGPDRTWRLRKAAIHFALVGHEHAKTALDVACWDIFGKSVDMPVCELLGGRTTARMPIISSIYMGDPDEMRSRVAEHRAKGYTGALRENR